MSLQRIQDLQKATHGAASFWRAKRGSRFSAGGGGGLGQARSPTTKRRSQKPHGQAQTLQNMDPSKEFPLRVRVTLQRTGCFSATSPNSRASLAGFHTEASTLAIHTVRRFYARPGSNGSESPDLDAVRLKTFAKGRNWLGTIPEPRNELSSKTRSDSEVH